MSFAMPAEMREPPVEPPNPASFSGAGRLRQEGLTDSDRNFAVAMHLTPLLGGVFILFLFAPLVLWLIRKDDSSFDDDHGREVVNMLLTGLVVGALCFTGIFIPVALIWVIVMFIALIRGAIAAGNGEYFRYPMVIRFIS